MNEFQAQRQADTDDREAPARRARPVRDARCFPTITVRPMPDEKARFRSIARQVGISESALALRAIRTLLSRHEPWLALQPELKWDHVAASDRITLRLRPGDGLEVIRRASERDMKPATYLSALIRAHLTGNPPLPVSEVRALKSSITVLAGLGTLLANTSGEGIPAGPEGEVYRNTLRRIRGEIAALEQRISDHAKAALIAWEVRT